MTGEVRNIEITLNVSLVYLTALLVLPIPALSLMLLYIVWQNFFTIVKALVAQARSGEPKSDGYHHYDVAETELVKRLASFNFKTLLQIERPVSLMCQVFTKANPPSGKPFVIRLIRLWHLMFFGNWCHVRTCI